MGQSGDRAEEITRRGQAIYDRQIRDRLSKEDRGKYLVLDLETGEYEVDPSDVVALERARALHPTGTFYILRIGSSAAYRIGRRDAVARS